MRSETAVVHAYGHNVHTEYYANPAARKTIIMVNGSLATTASFAQSLKYLTPQFNVVLYDQPYAGQSKPHNHHSHPISKEDEAEILLELIEHFDADYLSSFSWGGVAALLALAQRPKRIEKAVVGSFSPLLNEAMLDYLEKGLYYLRTVDRDNMGHLINNTIGKHLPSLFKRYNHRHISNLHDHEYRQMHAHIHKVLHLDTHCHMACLNTIDTPLLFINGEHDEYTTAQDARLFANYLDNCQFSTVINAGHFLDMEHKKAWQQTQDAMLGFLQSGTSQRRPLQDSATAIAV